MKFKSDIEVQAGIKDKDGQIGSSGQILASTGSQVDWIDQSDIISASSKLVVIACKNTSGATITKGTPVYQTGTVGATDVIEIAKADASDENKMAAIGLLQTDLINNAFGNVVITGELLNLITSPIDGTTPTTGDTIYVKPGGGLTLTKPTGVNFIQNVGLIGKVSTGNSGSITVSSIMRSNDVPTPLYIDHANQRLGIGITSPSEKLEVDGNIKSKRITLSHSGYTGYINQAGDFGGGPLYIRNMGQNHDINFQGNKGGTTSTSLHIDGLTHNIGIGTTSPSEKLEVSGNVKASTGNNNISIVPNNTNSSISTTSQSVQGAIISAVSDGLTFSSRDIYGGVNIGSFNNAGTVTLGAFGYGNVNYQTAHASFAHTWYGSRASDPWMTLNSTGLGIGTTSPDSLLEISTTDTTKNFIKLTSGAGSVNPTLIFEKSATEQGVIQYIRNGDLKLYNTDSDGGVMISGSGASNYDMYINNSGNVGIGTTSPDYALHVDPTVKIGDRQGTDGSLILQSQQGPNITFTSTGDNLDISGSTGSSNGNTIRLLDEIKVFEFHANIGGTIRINRGNRGLMDTNIGGYVVQQQNTTSSNGKSTFLSTDSSGTILRSTSYGGTGTSGDIQFQFGGGNNTSEPAPATKVIIKNDGKVGIGTASPSTNLEIVTSDPSNGIKLTTNTGNLWGTLLNTNSNAFPVGKLALRFGTSETASITARSNEMRIGGSQMNLTLYTSSSEKFRVDTNGNVGIGTTSPGTKLHVQGAASGYLFRVQGTSTLNVYDPGAAAEIGVGSGPGDKLKLFSNDSINNGITIDTSGNVGIGTTSPTYILDVVSSGTATARLKSAGTGAISLRYENGGGFKSAAVVDNNGLYRLDATNISLNPTSNVGIGTTSPGEKLDVRGNIHIEEALPSIIFKRNTSGLQEYSITNEGNFTIEKTTLDSGGSFIIKDENGKTPLDVSMGLLNPDIVVSGDLFVKNKTGATTNLYVQENNGYVGIGTTSPTAPLHVESPSDAVIRLKSTDNKSYISLSDNDTSGYISSENSKLSLGANAGVNADNLNIDLSNNRVGIGTSSPSYKLDVLGGGVRAGGVTTYSKQASTLDTTGYAVAGLTSSNNGSSAGFTFTCFGHTGDYQKIVYSCYNDLGTWKTKKVIDEGTNDFDVAASADGSTITFTFKSTSGTKNYTPRVTVEAVGSAINSTYA